jgi:hypothetical protein
VLRHTPAHQVIESRFALHIEMDDFTVQDGLARNRRSDGGRKLREALIRRSPARYQPTLPRVDIPESAEAIIFI